MQITYTSKLSDTVLTELERVSKKFKASKREIIESALNQYFDTIKRAEYVASFKRAKDDTEISEWTEMGLADFLKMVEL
jgi:predicted transcriptional regulator